MSVDFTRVIEHRHFYPNLEFTESLISREFSKETLPIDEPFYPKRLSSDLEKLNKYSALAKSLPNIFFIGRLGTYRYLDMDKIIEEALELSHKFLVENS
jgi:UDP-galactopyranose mutase